MSAAAFDSCDALHLAVRKYIGSTVDLMNQIRTFKWEPDEGLFPIVVRAAAVRQHEFMNSVITIAAGAYPFTAVAMLRPACEELIWLRYLKTLEFIGRIAS